jgi:hypothetical protein
MHKYIKGLGDNALRNILDKLLIIAFLLCYHRYILTHNCLQKKPTAEFLTASLQAIKKYKWSLFNLLFAICTRKPDSLEVNMPRKNKHTDCHILMFSESVLN